MTEIGGYLELEHFSGLEYYPSLIAVNTARNALRYIILAKNIKKLYVPYFLCSSVIEVCIQSGISYERYHISENFCPEINVTLSNGEYLYLVNYYGQLVQEQILALKAQYQAIILDNVQAFFQPPIEGIDTIYSCRKFFGVPDGAYLATDTYLNMNLEHDKSEVRMGHLMGRLEWNAAEFYSDFRNSEASLKSEGLKAMSALTHNLLRAVDYNLVRKKRTENYSVLAEKLDEQNPLSLSKNNVPFCYPFYCKNGMEIKRQLAKENIYIPTLWPDVLALNDCLERDYAKNILPLPCDQRYDSSDMLHVVNALLRCQKINSE